jgi:hypothetical protein
MKTIIENALNEYVNEVKNNINTSKIEEITNLPSKFRWSASKEFLTKSEIKVIEKTGVRKSEHKQWIQRYFDVAKTAIKYKSYHSSDFGRYQSTHAGNNVLPSQVSVRTEIGERYNKKYHSNDLYSDFFFVAQEDNPFNFMYKTPAMGKPGKLSFFDLSLTEGKEGFIFDHPLFKRCNFEFDKKEISVKLQGMEYHIQNVQVFSSQENNEKVIRSIISAFQNRKRNLKKDAAFNSLNLSEINVTINDSIKSGNCEVGTNSFATKYFANELKEGKEITAKMIWSVRKDEYTKRAIIQAAKI